MPGERPAPHRAGGGIGDLAGGPDHHRLLARTRLRQACAFGRGQHLARIDQRARSLHQEVPRHRHAVVDVAVFQVEFLAQIGAGIPAAQVVIDRHAREPLPHLVDVAVLRRRHRRAAAPGPRYGVMPGDMQPQVSAVRRQHRRQPDLHPRVGHQERHGHACAVRLDGDALDHVAVGGMTLEIARREMRAGAGLVGVLVELHPEHVQRVGAVVGVGDRLAAVQHVRTGLDRRLDGVVSAILPVGRPWQPAARAIRVRPVALLEGRKDHRRIGRRQWRGRPCRPGMGDVGMRSRGRRGRAGRLRVGKPRWRRGAEQDRDKKAAHDRHAASSRAYRRNARPSLWWQTPPDRPSIKYLTMSMIAEERAGGRAGDRTDCFSGQGVA